MGCVPKVDPPIVALAEVSNTISAELLLGRSIVGLDASSHGHIFCLESFFLANQNIIFESIRIARNGLSYMPYQEEHKRFISLGAIEGTNRAIRILREKQEKEKKLKGLVNGR